MEIRVNMQPGLLVNFQLKPACLNPIIHGYLARSLVPRYRYTEIVTRHTSWSIIGDKRSISMQSKDWKAMLFRQYLLKTTTFLTNARFFFSLLQTLVISKSYMERKTFTISYWRGCLLIWYLKFWIGYDSRYVSFALDEFTWDWHFFFGMADLLMT